jgi:hypothetical protein
MTKYRIAFRKEETKSEKRLQQETRGEERRREKTRGYTTAGTNSVPRLNSTGTTSTQIGNIARCAIWLRGHRRL